MVGRVNSGGGLGKLVTAYAEKSVPQDSGSSEVTYVTLTCDFDPLVIATAGPNYFDETGTSDAAYRLSKKDSWIDAYYQNGLISYISISGRTITAGPFKGHQNYDTTAYLRAWGLPD